MKNVFSYKLNSEKIIKLYKGGLTPIQIARKLNFKKDNIVDLLKYYKVLRRRLGYTAEREVEEYFRKLGENVVRQSAIAPFDLLINGEKVDVKSSHLLYDKTHNQYAYSFQIADNRKKIIPKDIQSEIDWFCLVFLKEEPQITAVYVRIRVYYLIQVYLITDNLANFFILYFVA